MKTLLITGSVGSGKSSLVNRIASEYGLKFSGIKSKKVFKDGNIIGYDLIILNGDEILQQYKLARFEEKTKIYVEVFELVKKHLEKMLKGDDDFPILIDEVGRFEKNNFDYLNIIKEIADSDRFSILVLKKEDLSFNNLLIRKAKTERDMAFFDLDFVDDCDIENLIEKISVENAFKRVHKEKILYLEKNEKLNIDDFSIKYIDLKDESVDKFFDPNDFNIFFSKNTENLKRASDLGFVAVSCEERLKRLLI